MTLGQKIKELRESEEMLQSQLAAILIIGDGYLTKVESDQNVIKRELFKTIGKTSSFPFDE